jgi:cytoskeletal protein RodZ
VRLEIETALRMDKPLIPVLVSRAVMPHPDVLPASLRDFVFRNAVQVDSGQDFDVHVGRLIRAMERLLPIDEARAAEAVQGVVPAIEASPSIEPTPKAEPPADPLAPSIGRPSIRAKGDHTVRRAIALGLVVILGITGASGWWVLVERPAEMAQREAAAVAKAQQEEQARQAAAAAKAQQEEQARAVAAAAKARQEEEARQQARQAAAAAKAQQEEQARQAAVEAQADWYRWAAYQGNAKAQYSMGVVYENSGNYAEAMRWFRKAADQGDADAQIRIGWLYYYGGDVAQDYAEAMRWFRKAADQGNASAEYSVGKLYEEGKGVAKDNAEAIRWYRMAAHQGDAAAKHALENLR